MGKNLIPLTRLLKKYKQSVIAQTVFIMVKKGIKTLAETITEKRLTTVAGAWVYYFLTASVPLAFLLITAFGVFGVNISRDFVSRLPESFRAAGEAIVSTAENASKGVTLFFIITVLFSSSTLLNQMSKDGDFIYGVKSKHKRGVLRRLWAVVAIAILFLLFLSAAFLFAFGNMVISGVASINGELFLSFLTFSLAITFGYVIIITLDKFISPVKQKLSQISLGALCSLFIIVLGTIGFTVYLKFFNNYNAFYGSLAAIVVFLLWAYILMLGLVTGVVINMRAYERSKLKQKNKMRKENSSPEQSEKDLRGHGKSPLKPLADA